MIFPLRWFSIGIKQQSVSYLGHHGQWNSKGKSDQITAVFCGTMDGEFLPPQLIYQGKTKACLPKHLFSSGWHITYTPNHWSNEETMKEYVLKIIVPFVKSTRQKLKLNKDQAALALFASLLCQLYRSASTNGFDNQ